MKPSILSVSTIVTLFFSFSVVSYGVECTSEYYNDAYNHLIQFQNVGNQGVEVGIKCNDDLRPHENSYGVPVGSTENILNADRLNAENRFGYLTCTKAIMSVDGRKIGYFESTEYDAYKFCYYNPKDIANKSNQSPGTGNYGFLKGNIVATPGF